MNSFSTADTIRTLSVEGTHELTADELKKLQGTLLSMLDDIKSVMDANDINYSLGGGSVLGAIRHNGIIPWDDDIDINISRAEFMRFVPLFRARFSDKYWIRIPGLTPGHVLLFPQIRLKGTSVRTRDDLNNEECGACIDFFFVEETYDSLIRRKWHELGCLYHGMAVSCRKFYRDRAFLKEFAHKSGNTSLIRMTRLKVLIGALYAGRSLDKMVARADRFYGKCKTSGKYEVVPTGRHHFNGELYSKGTLLECTTHDFNGRQAPVPVKYDEYLTHMYGEYMEIPKDAGKEKHIFLEPFSI